jgi:hypothetical protein
MNIKSIQLSKYKSLLGISFEDSRMTACELRSSGNQIESRRTLRATLALDLLTGDPELVGNEIRKHLNEAGIREKRCVVCVPLKWALALQVELPPALSEADVESFIKIQAERDLPFAPEDLSLSVSRYTASDNTRWATIVGLRANHLTTLQKVFKAAQLQLCGITFGITCLAVEDHASPIRQAGLVEPKEESGAVLLLAHESGLDMEIAAGGGIAALRVLAHAVETGPEGTTFDIDTIVRELRITLGKLPTSMPGAIRSARIFGTSDLTNGLLEQLRKPLADLGMSVEKSLPDTASQLSRQSVAPAHGSIPPEELPSAYAAAAGRLLDRPCAFEFLPPRIHKLRQIASQVSARGALWLAGAGIALVLIIGTAFMLQYQYLLRLERKWTIIQPKVNELEKLQNKLREFRPWYDNSIQSLNILQKITTAFPEEGSVWVKSLEVKGMSKIQCSGDARSNRDWLEMLERLRQVPGIEDLQVLQVRGNSPVEFRLSFRWNGESRGI